MSNLWIINFLLLFCYPLVFLCICTQATSYFTVDAPIVCMLVCGYLGVSATSLGGVPKLNIIKAQINVFNSQKLCHSDHGSTDPRTARNRRLLAPELFHFFPGAIFFYFLFFYIQLSFLCFFARLLAVRTFWDIRKFFGWALVWRWSWGFGLLLAGCFFPESFMRFKLKYFHRAFAYSKVVRGILENHRFWLLFKII